MAFHDYDFFFGNPCFLLVALSPSASHLLALTSCKTLRNCLAAMTGLETPAMTHGQKLSILFARASSIAHALPGAAKNVEGENAGLPGCVEAPADFSVGRSDGESVGEEKESR